MIAMEMMAVMSNFIPKYKGGVNWNQLASPMLSKEIIPSASAAR